MKQVLYNRYVETFFEFKAACGELLRSPRQYRE
jgi:hypothetical protein